MMWNKWLHNSIEQKKVWGPAGQRQQQQETIKQSLKRMLRENAGAYSLLFFAKKSEGMRLTVNYILYFSSR